ncbi:MAG: nucleoside-diphosphate sugar epimerase/dehydratase [Acidobacteriota bacterium]
MRDEAGSVLSSTSPHRRWRFRPPPLRPLLVLCGDAVIAVLSLVAAYHLRFDDPSPYYGDLPLLAATLVVARIAVNARLRLHYWSFKFSNLRDGARIGVAGLSGSAAFVALGYFVLRDHVALPPRGVFVLELLLSCAAMAAIRFGPRLAFTYRADLWPRRRRGVVRTLIVGAGASGEMLLRDLQRGGHDPQRRDTLHVVGFVDDDRHKWGHIVGGKPVLGALDELPRLAARHHVELVVLAIARLPSRRLRALLSLPFHRPMRFKMLPTGYGQLQDRDIAAALRDVSEADLLVREVLTFDHRGAAPSVDPERQLLVAGAAGSIGREVCRQLLELGARRLVMLDIDENGLYVLKRRFDREYPDRDIVAEVADLREPRRLARLMVRYRPRDIFHAAARKHVPLMEAAPCEAVKTNVIGTLHLARVASNYGAERFVYTSTDKAVAPTSVMGATKKIGEMLMRALDREAGEHGVRFIVVRFGNVLDSAGSVVPLFREQIAAGGPVTITHPEIQRYFMTISEAVGLVLRAAYGDHGRLCVLEMGEPLRIVDLARQMITMAGLVPDVDVRLEYTGLRPGEKLFEELMAADESVAEQIDEKIRIVRAPPPPDDLFDHVEELARRADGEDDAAVVELLRRLVPDFRPVERRAASLEPLAESAAVTALDPEHAVEPVG